MMKGAWAEVRRRMKEKAVELYMNDQCRATDYLATFTDNLPTVKELRELGYIREAKRIVLQEMHEEGKM